CCMSDLSICLSNSLLHFTKLCSMIFVGRKLTQYQKLPSNKTHSTHSQIHTQVVIWCLVFGCLWLFVVVCGCLWLFVQEPIELRQWFEFDKIVLMTRA